MPFNTTTGDGIFKRNYDEGSDVLIAQQNLHAPTFKKFKVSPLKPTPQGIFMPVAMSGNENGGAIFENQGFQDPGSLNPIQPQITSKLTIWNFELSGTVMELSETNKQAFVPALDAQQEDNAGRMYSDLNRQACGTGIGQMATTTGALLGATTLPVSNVLPFRRGMQIDAWTAVGGTKEATFTVTAVNFNANPPNLSVSALPAAITSGDILVKKTILDGVGTGSEGKELSGIQKIVDTTTFGTTFENVSVSTNPEWQGNVIDGSTAPVSQDLLQRTWNRNWLVGGGEADFLLSNKGQQRTFLNTELNKTRYEPGKVEGGATVLKWQDMEWIADKDYPLNELCMLQMGKIMKFQTRDVHLSQNTGSTLYQKTGFDAVAGYYAYYGNMGTWKRNAHARLINLTEPLF